MIRMARDAVKRTRLLTARDYMRLPDDGRRHELVDGELLMSPSAFFGHGDLVLYVGGLLRRHVAAGRLGRVTTETDLVLAEHLVLRPDISFVARRRERIIRGHIYGPPDLAIEITSPDNRTMDVFTKKRDYERYGVREYWVLDIVKQPFVAYQWTLRRGAYVGGPLTTATLKSTVVKGFSLRLKDVWDVLK